MRGANPSAPLRGRPRPNPGGGAPTTLRAPPPNPQDDPLSTSSALIAALTSSDVRADQHRLLFIHAHPDDEAAQTGALTAWATGRGIAVAVLTCTRGEEGEYVPGTLADGDDLVTVRARELAGSLRELAVDAHAYLGTEPALREGAQPRHYRDSGMQWVAPGVAGPADTTDERTFTAAPIAEAAADASAFAADFGATAIISYDQYGSYGHPDHVRAHEVAVETARVTGLPMLEVLSPVGPESDAGFTRLDASDGFRAAQRALAHYPTQMRVDGDELVHVGGQRTPIETSVGLRGVEVGA